MKTKEQEILEKIVNVLIDRESFDGHPLPDRVMLFGEEIDNQLFIPVALLREAKAILEQSKC